MGDFVGASVRFGTVPGSSIPLEARLLPGSHSRKTIGIKGFIPSPGDQNLCAQSRKPMDMITPTPARKSRTSQAFRDLV